MTAQTRRLIFATLTIGTMMMLFTTMAYSFHHGGFVLVEVILLTCFAITLPWTVIGFWNAVIGFFLLRLSKDPASHVFPGLREISNTEPVTTSTALALCIRNEEVDQVVTNLNAMVARLIASGEADHFKAYVLSDSSFPEVIEQEEKAFAALEKKWQGRFSIEYRRREDNPGFKAGNLMDFCDRWGSDHDFMLTLDADSVMSASTILRMVRVMQANDKVGILQSLVVGLPSESAFTRIFQFGMRMGMKSYTIGSAWWQADCGPYWGHNALIRLKPFMESCHLPILSGKGPLSGYVLSHDQVEAAFMRRAGYECRVMAEESGSFEENPPHILEFIRRDLRWCHGNMQYLKLLNQPGLYLTSRIQLVLAILMFVSSPAWILFIVTTTFAYAYPNALISDQQLASENDLVADSLFASVGSSAIYYTFAIIMTMIFAPKIASFLDTLARSELRRSFGGWVKITSSFFLEIIFSMLIAPIVAIANTVFLFQLFVFGKAKSWAVQSRTTQSLPFAETARKLLPQTLFGAIGLFVINWFNLAGWTVVLISLPVFLGPLLATPLGMLSSRKDFGEFFTKLGFCQLPEENAPPVILRGLNLEAVSIRAEYNTPNAGYQPLTIEEMLKLDNEYDESVVGLNEPIKVPA